MSLSPGMRFGRYELVSFLGAGGMGEVYRARDHSLGRDIAIKFLPARYAADAERLARFSHEARAASSLNHPNIVTIHEIGEAEGQPFIAMEFVEGERLRTLMANGRLPVKQALDLAAQMADGLAKAHAAGIVHRDLKPENVIVTPDGFAKIVDFGLAKLTRDIASGGSDAEAETEARQDGLTGGGAILGTVGYMAPEQAAGKAVDYRADQFSLGTMLYEMATGTRAFHRDSVVQTLNAIIESEPEPVSSLNPAFPAPGRWIVERCLAKKPADRYASTLDLARELHGVRDHLGETSGVSAAQARRAPARRWRPWYWLVGVVALAAGIVIGPAAFDTLLQRMQWLPLPSAKRVAVLPIHNPGGTREEAALCDGMLDYVVARLVEMQRFHETLWVVPAGDVRESGVTAPAGARRGLGATLAVELAVQKVGGEFVMSFSLTDTTASPPRLLRSKTLRVPAGESLLDHAVDEIVAMLEVEVSPTLRAAMKAGGTAVAEASTLFAQGTQELAHTPFERGLSALQQYDRQQQIEQAISLFQAALERDPNYALAHAGLSQAYLRLFQITRREQYVALSEQHARRALELDTLSARPWLALAILHRETGKGTESIDEFATALDREPRNAEVIREKAVALTRLNRIDEAEQAYRQAIALNPDAWASHAAYGWFLVGRSRAKDAEAVLNRALGLAPDNARVWSNMGVAYYQQNRMREAEEAFSKSASLHATSSALANLATLQYRRGDLAGAVRTLEQSAQVSERDYRVWRNLAAACYWAPGQRDRARPAYLRAASLAEQERQFDPKSVTLLVALADCKAMTGDAAAAKALLAEAAQLSPAADRLAEMADVYETLGDRAQALRLLDQALAGGYPRAQVESSRALAELRKDPRYSAIGKARPEKAGASVR